jgi:CRP-like cAMP-binding protein
MGRTKATTAEKTLAEVRLFEQLDKREIKHLAQVADVLSVPEGKVLIREGGLGRELIVILDGAADVLRGGHTIATIGPGDAVGEMALLDHQEATASVVTTAPSEIVVIDGRRFRPLLEEMPGLSISLLATVSSRLREADKAFDV